MPAFRPKSHSLVVLEIQVQLSEVTDNTSDARLQIAFISGLRRGMQDGRKVGGIVSGASYFNGGSRHEQEICLLTESEAEFMLWW